MKISWTISLFSTTSIRAWDREKRFFKNQKFIWEAENKGKKYFSLLSYLYIFFKIRLKIRTAWEKLSLYFLHFLKNIQLCWLSKCSVVVERLTFFGIFLWSTFSTLSCRIKKNVYGTKEKTNNWQVMHSFIRVKSCAIKT